MRRGFEEGETNSSAVSDRGIRLSASLVSFFFAGLWNDLWRQLLCLSLSLCHPATTLPSQFQMPHLSPGPPYLPIAFCNLPFLLPLILVLCIIHRKRSLFFSMGPSCAYFIRECTALLHCLLHNLPCLPLPSCILGDVAYG